MATQAGTRDTAGRTVIRQVGYWMAAFRSLAKHARVDPAQSDQLDAGETAQNNLADSNLTELLNLGAQRRLRVEIPRLTDDPDCARAKSVAFARSLRRRVSFPP